MTDNELLDLFSDYLISAFGQTTATGLATLLDGQGSHDRVQRFLAGTKRTSSDLWQTVKPHVRAIQLGGELFMSMRVITQFLRRWLAKLVLEYIPCYYQDW